MNITQVTPLIEAKTELFFPSIISFLILFTISYWSLALLVFSKKTNWSKIFTHFILILLILGIVFGFLSASPEMFYDWFLKLKDFFN